MVYITTVNPIPKNIFFFSFDTSFLYFIANSTPAYGAINRSADTLTQIISVYILLSS